MGESSKGPKPFAERVAVVTGGTQGVGAATARMLAERGAAGIVLTGRNAEKGAQVAGEIEAAGADVMFHRADLADPAACESIIPAAEERFGAVHLLANCAGLTDRGSLWDTTPELFDRLFHVNVLAPQLLIRDTANLMRKHGVSGAIVNVISMAMHGGPPNVMTYSASKGALATLTKNAAFTLLPYGIRVNGLNIGWTFSEGEDAIMRQAHDATAGWQEKVGTIMPRGRLLTTREVAQGIVFYLSDEAGLTTGSIVDYDQGVLGCMDWPPK